MGVDPSPLIGLPPPLTQQEQDQERMRLALELAHRAALNGEVPVGALLYHNDKIIAEGWNRPISQSDPTCHAEIVAIRAACRYRDNYRIPDTTLYVTLEPCAMCAGAIIQARISRVVFGAFDYRSGCGGSVYQLLCSPHLNHRVELRAGVLGRECGELLQSFFRSRR
ncbi:MAG: tRNA adenosine(34) deaminase TadA [Gammaproteobacteria bacterium]|nr:tRNA adenosine(34) deaminase TadA [Gammaproteobacteria bacterium]